MPPVVDPDPFRYCFDLPDSNGRFFSLETRRGVGPTVIAFYRGHWCPYCRRYLAKLQLHQPRLTQGGTGLIAISNEPWQTSASLVRELGLTYPVLSDPTGVTIDKYGVRNGFRGAAALVHPAVFILDDQLRLRFKSIDRNYKVRTSMRAIAKQLDAISAASV